MMLQKWSLALGKNMSNQQQVSRNFHTWCWNRTKRTHTHIFFLLENKFCCIFWQFQITNCCWVPLRMQKKSSSTLAAFFLFFLRPEGSMMKIDSQDFCHRRRTRMTNKSIGFFFLLFLYCSFTFFCQILHFFPFDTPISFISLSPFFQHAIIQ